MLQTQPGHSRDVVAGLAGRVRQDTPAAGPAAVNGMTHRAGAAVTRIPGRGGFGGNPLGPAPGRPASDDMAPLSATRRLDTAWPCGPACEPIICRQRAPCAASLAALLETL